MTALHKVTVPHESVLVERLTLDVFADLWEAYKSRSETFYHVAQAVSKTLPNDSKEKLLDGFLVGRERVREEVTQAAQQGRLFE